VVNITRPLESLKISKSISLSWSGARWRKNPVIEEGTSGSFIREE
jgi:hypothetical protein